MEQEVKDGRSIQEIQEATDTYSTFLKGCLPNAKMSSQVQAALAHTLEVTDRLSRLLQIGPEGLPTDKVLVAMAKAPIIGREPDLETFGRFMESKRTGPKQLGSVVVAAIDVFIATGGKNSLLEHDSIVWTGHGSQQYRRPHLEALEQRYGLISIGKSDKTNWELNPSHELLQAIRQGAQSDLIERVRADNNRMHSEVLSHAMARR